MLHYITIMLLCYDGVIHYITVTKYLCMVAKKTNMTAKQGIPKGSWM